MSLSLACEVPVWGVDGMSFGLKQTRVDLAAKGRRDETCWYSTLRNMLE